MSGMTRRAPDIGKRGMNLIAGGYQIEFGPVAEVVPQLTGRGIQKIGRDEIKLVYLWLVGLQKIVT
jgi:hypothetical protein